MQYVKSSACTPVMLVVLTGFANGSLLGGRVSSFPFGTRDVIGDKWVLCACCYNIRKIPALLRAVLALIIAVLLADSRPLPINQIARQAV
jgi:hypothetical protein